MRKVLVVIFVGFIFCIGLSHAQSSSTIDNTNTKVKVTSHNNHYIYSLELSPASTPLSVSRSKTTTYISPALKLF
jgi:hypothetical protein